MKRHDFISILESSSTASPGALQDIRELIGVFPYFQTAHMLLLKGLKDNDDVRFDSQLKRSAIYIADREVLYYLLQKQKSSPDAGEVNVTEQTTPEIVIEEIPADNTIEKVAQGNTPEEVIEENAVEQVAQENIPEEDQVPVNVEETRADSQQTVIETAKNSEALIKEYEEENIDRKNEDTKESTPGFVTRTVLMSVEPEDDVFGGSVFVFEDEAVPAEEKIFYMDPGISVPRHHDLLEVDFEEETVSPGASEPVVSDNRTEELPSPEAESSTAEPDASEQKKHTQAELIDRFIQLNPRIEPVKDLSDLPPEDLSKPFVEEKGGFISETLAKIYLNQGYYSRAVDIYEKLCLKFPEKCSYFAAQIEKIKELIKQV